VKVEVLSMDLFIYFASASDLVENFDAVLLLLMSGIEG